MLFTGDAGQGESNIRRWLIENDWVEAIVALDPLLDPCKAIYKTTLGEDGQVDFKGKEKAFVRTYDFFASILPYSNGSWKKLSIFLTMLVRKLPAPKEEDLSKGILDAINREFRKYIFQSQVWSLSMGHQSNLRAT